MLKEPKRIIAEEPTAQEYSPHFPLIRTVIIAEAQSPI